MNLNPLLEASPAIQIHVAAAVLAIALSGAMIAVRKGTTRHKLIGRMWVAMLATICLTSFFITQLNNGHFSWIHLLSSGTLVGLAYAIWAVRHGYIRAHKYAMISTMVGALGGAGAFTFMPDRLLGQVFFG